ncbi:exonuclease domain-containing protein [Mycoplasma aquilae ATCC BAA-1896]|uniref:exonuclease domain-containing protein n=1 Tax=Mycoplasma aquilae TaxID=1312741 RepID=UPI003A87C0D4
MDYSNTHLDNYVVLDIETTGLQPYNDEITEIAAIKVKNGKIVEQFSKLVKIQGVIPPFIVKKTHITNEMLRNEDPIEIVLAQFLEFIEDLPLIGHNIKSFDYRFLNYFSNSRLNWNISNEIIDTLLLARTKLSLAHNTLGDLCNYYAIEYSAEKNHRALADVICTDKVYKKLCNEKSKARNWNLTRTKRNFEPYSNNKMQLKSNALHSNLLEGFNIAITGEGMYSRESLERVIELNGGKVNNSVLKSTTLLISCDDQTTTLKYIKAQQLQKRIVKLEEFLELLRKLEIID